MSKEYTLCWSAHPNIYDSLSPRELNFCFTEPEAGVNDETGIVLLIPGFGANSRSKVYSKMRKQFSDQYNLIAVQCDFFGQEYMNEYNNLKLDMNIHELSSIFSNEELINIMGGLQNDPNYFFKIAQSKDAVFQFKEQLDETKANFNDMGIMQALDNLTALFYVISILKENGYRYNTKRIILYGHSHGAYLGYLCNAFFPGLFSLLIDNSAWLFPEYLKPGSNRYLQGNIGGSAKIKVLFEYLASKLNVDTELLDLNFLYRKVTNHCHIESFHGVDDSLVPLEKKINFSRAIEKLSLHTISNDAVDHRVFNSTEHGLDADFLEMFDSIIKQWPFQKSHELDFSSSTIKTSANEYRFTVNSGVPMVTISSL